MENIDGTYSNLGDCHGKDPSRQKQRVKSAGNNSNSMVGDIWGAAIATSCLCIVMYILSKTDLCFEDFEVYIYIYILRSLFMHFDAKICRNRLGHHGPPLRAIWAISSNIMACTKLLSFPLKDFPGYPLASFFFVSSHRLQPESSTRCILCAYRIELLKILEGSSRYGISGSLP